MFWYGAGHEGPLMTCPPLKTWLRKSPDPLPGSTCVRDGAMHGYAGYNRLLKRPARDVRLARANGREPVAPSLARCWAHARRKLHDVAQSGTAPIAQEGLAQVQELYRIKTCAAEPQTNATLHGKTAQNHPSSML